MGEAPTAARGDDADLSRVKGVGSDDLILRTRGRKRGTWAHWQLAMAYAHYLSPAFHAWCNQVLRDGMKGGCHPSSTSAEPIIGYLQQQFGALHHRLDTLDRHGGDIMFLVISSQELMMGRRRSFSQLSQATMRRVAAVQGTAPMLPCDDRFVAGRRYRLGCGIRPLLPLWHQPAGTWLADLQTVSRRLRPWWLPGAVQQNACLPRIPGRSSRFQAIAISVNPMTRRSRARHGEMRPQAA